MRTNGVADRITLFGQLQEVLGPILDRFRKVQFEAGHAYAACLGLTACGFASGLVAVGSRLQAPWAVAALCVFAAIAERSRVRLDANGLEGSIALLPSLFAAVLFGPLAAMVVGAASFAGHFGTPHLKWLVYTSSRAVTWAVSGMLAAGAGDLAGSRFGSIAFAATVGAVASNALDTAFAGVAFRLRGYGRFAEVYRTVGPLALASVLLFTPVVVLLAIAYQELSPWTLGLFFVPALGAQRLFLLYQEQRQLAQDLAAANARLERANLSFATALIATMDARDRWTAGHSAAVAIYARDIAARMSLSEKDQKLAHLCGFVHDIGKARLPAELLEKPGALTLDERRQMQEHSAIGERILAKVEDYAEIAGIVRHHHERWDGEGYPDGIAGEAIPLLSRIIAVADAYNAMTSDRPYRDAMPSRVARMRLAQSVESQFDTAVVAAFEAVLASADEEYRSGTRTDFDLQAQDLSTLNRRSLARAA